MRKTFFQILIAVLAFNSIQLMAQRPDHWNNALTKYFPPVFNQSGGSCGSAQNVGYIFTHDMASIRDVDASLEENQYPSHFRWLPTYSYGFGHGHNIAIENGEPNVIAYGGRTHSKYFGYQDYHDKDFGWMQGYDKWYSAMFNRVLEQTNYHGDVMTEEGREYLKNFLWNRNGDKTYHGGSCFGFGAAAGPNTANIGVTETNKSIGVSGMRYVTSWGDTYNHALTVCGYDDRIEFDLNGNGIYGEKSNDEVGAWIICNSWGDSWENKGFVYCPYKYSYGVRFDEIKWNPEIQIMRLNYRPLRTIKVKMDYSHRSEIALEVGVSQDTSAVDPEKSIYLSHFHYDGDCSQASVPPAVPMLGKWVDGYNYDPMEFGYDLTDLTSSFECNKPLKYFFKIHTDSQFHNSALGTGHLYNCSIIDYEYDTDGMETPFKLEKVENIKGGSLYTYSVVIWGEETKAPSNPKLNGSLLTWNNPGEVSLRPFGINIYKNNVLYQQVNTKTNSYNVDDESASYSLTTVYEYRGVKIESEKSEMTSNPIRTDMGINKVLSLKNASFSFINLFDKKLLNATIEFYIKPTNYGMTIGKWGDFMITISNSGQLQAGWDKNNTENYATTNTNSIKKNEWTHIAVVVEKNVISIYLNGMKKQTKTSSTFSGIPVMNELQFNGVNGDIDELRIWNTARNNVEIFSNKNTKVAIPALHPTLIAYCNMELLKEHFVDKIRELKNSNHAILTAGNFEEKECDDILNDSPSTAPSFNMPTTPLYAGILFKPNITVPVNIISINWEAEDSQEKTSSLLYPDFTFISAGKHNVKFTLTDTKGNVKQGEKEFDFKDSQPAIVDFDIVQDGLARGEKFTFANKTIGSNCSFYWQTTESDKTYFTTNASIIFNKAGDFDVTLYAKMANGSIVSKTKQIHVINAVPKVDFNIHPSNILLGEKIYVTDKTQFDPISWKWEIVKPHRYNIIDGQNSSFTPKAPGFYDVTLISENEFGEAKKTIKNAFVVSNADPGKALSFNGENNQIELEAPLKESTKSFSFDMWLNPNEIKGAINMATSDGQFSTSVDINGKLTFKVGNKTVNSENDYVIPGWHYYAITYNAGTVKFYRDTELIYTPSTRLSLNASAWKGTLTFGDTQTPFNGLIDEFRFWKTELKQEKQYLYANQPITDIKSAMEFDNLIFYYDFNQVGGNVIDRTGNGYTGTRKNFGPDGDAWNYVEGVFTLDFAEKEGFKDISSNYLTNYSAPFAVTPNKTVNRYNTTRFKDLLKNTNESKWILKNVVNINNILTGVYVDNTDNLYFEIRTGQNSFAEKIENHLAYQVLDLPAGAYRFSATNGLGIEGNNYIVVNLGDELCDNTTFRTEALAYNDLTDGEVVFILDEPSKVAVGLIFNMEGKQATSLKSFNLELVDGQNLKADGLTNIYDAVKSGKDNMFTPVNGGLKIVTDKTTNVRIYDINGICIFNDMVQGVHIIPLHEGIYIVNGITLEIKK